MLALLLILYCDLLIILIFSSLMKDQASDEDISLPLLIAFGCSIILIGAATSSVMHVMLFKLMLRYFA